MTYSLSNDQKIEMLNNNCIPFIPTNNTISIYWEGVNASPIDVTNISDEKFNEIVNNYYN